MYQQKVTTTWKPIFYEVGNTDKTITPVGLAGDKSSNWWGNTKKYIVSLLKAWYGDAATADNEFAFHYLPKKNPSINYTHIGLIEAMGRGIIKGLWNWGQNPASDCQLSQRCFIPKTAS